MNLYRASSFGLDRTSFIIAANSADEALKIAREQDMGSIDPDDVWECNGLLSTFATEPSVLEQF